MKCFAGSEESKVCLGPHPQDPEGRQAQCRVPKTSAHSQNQKFQEKPRKRICLLRCFYQLLFPSSKE